jgi:hypothetical protein
MSIDRERQGEELDELGEGERIADSLVMGQVVTEPRIERGRVVIHVLDNVSLRVFVALLDKPGNVTIESMVGEASTPPSAAERARAAATALAHSRQDEETFNKLFAELADGADPT